MVREPQTQKLLAAGFVRHTEIVKDRLQEGRAVGEMAVGEEGAGRPRVKPIEQREAEQRLAGAGRAGQEDEALAVAEATH